MLVVLQAVLRFVGYASWRAAVAGEGARRQVAFYQVLACEVLQAAPRIDEGLAGLLLPHVRAGLAKGARQEWRAAAHAVLGKLAALTTLSTVVLSGALGCFICLIRSHHERIDILHIDCKHTMRQWLTLLCSDTLATCVSHIHYRNCAIPVNCAVPVAPVS